MRDLRAAIRNQPPAEHEYDWAPMHMPGSVQDYGVLVVADPHTRRVLFVSENAAEMLGWPFGRAVQLLTVTAARRSEVLGLDWAELDLDAGLWRLPAARSKNGEAHVIHLSPQAVAIVKSLRDFKDGKLPKAGLAFSTTGKTPIGGITKYKARLDMIAKVKAWRLHDLRRTAATGMSGMGFSLTVVERVLNHRGVSRSGVAGIYQRAEFLPERKVALTAWGERVAALVEGRKPADNVFDFTGRRTA